MITTYLLQNCKYCKELFNYIKKNPNLNICLIIVSKYDIEQIKKNEPRIKQFPIAFTGNPKKNGLPYKNSHIITGSSTILDTLKNNYGKLNDTIKIKGTNIKIDYLNNNDGNISSLTNIRKHRNNCFGSSCYVMDRPFDSTDNQYILQGYQPSCSRPIRSDLPIKNIKNINKSNNFGITTPGTEKWKSERKYWPPPRILVDDSNTKQYLNANQHLGINVPKTYKNDYLNRKIWNPLNINNFGTKKLNKFISAPVNQTAPFLTYSAGGNGVSRVTGKNFLREQIPIQRSPKTSYISGNIKQYISNNLNNQKLLAGGLNSPWYINAQGINNYGNTEILSNESHRYDVPDAPGSPYGQGALDGPYGPFGPYGQHEPRGPDGPPIYNKPPVPNSPNIPIISNKPFGDKNPWTLTRTISGDHTNQAQYFKRQRFDNNGNSYGKSNKNLKSKIKTLKPKLKPKPKSNKKKMKFTSPLGIEISFN